MQINLGSDNANYRIKEMIVNLSQEGNINAKNFFEEFSKSLKEYDSYINEELGIKVVINKTNSEEDFIASKILTSLLSIGIPIDAAFTIYNNTIADLIKRNNENEIETLDTKTIRKVTCDSIQKCDLDKYPPSLVLKWGEKYVRKYGRNNQVVKIQLKNGELTEISMKFLKDVFVTDLLQTISPNLLVNKITLTERRQIAECVLDFVNSCDVYIIKYDTLKQIILEIALQPPHPWFINEETQSSIIDYDYKQLKINLIKMSASFKENIYVIPQSIIIEVIHHASSMILAKYDYFLGCNDLSSLHLLMSLMEQLIAKPYSDLLIDEYPINTLLIDIAKSKINYIDYFDLIKEIQKGINGTKMNTATYSQAVYEFAKKSVQIIDNSKLPNQLSRFYELDWSNCELKEIMDNIYTFMCITFGNNTLKSEQVKVNNHFWFGLNKFDSNVLDASKKKFYVFYGNNAEEDLSFCLEFSSGNIKALCSTILVITESEEIGEKLKTSIQDILEEYNCLNHYLVIDLNKENIKNIINSNNPAITFENIVTNKILIS